VGDHGARQLSPLLPRRLIRPDRHGGYVLNLSGDDRELLRQLIPEFAQLFDDPDQPVLRRVFPPAYSSAEHAEQQDEYRRLMQEDLVARHREELELVATTAAADHLSEEQLLAWSRALNSLRLVLGTYLDIQESDDGRAPTNPAEALYQWLSFLLDEAIDALGTGM
jgi:hypothetical protein